MSEPELPDGLECGCTEAGEKPNWVWQEDEGIFECINCGATYEPEINEEQETE